MGDIGKFEPDDIFAEEVSNFLNGDIEICYRLAVKLANVGPGAAETLAFLVSTASIKEKKKLAARALVKIGDPSIFYLARLLEADRVSASIAANALVAIGKPALPELRGMEIEDDRFLKRVHIVIDNIEPKKATAQKKTGKTIHDNEPDEGCLPDTVSGDYHSHLPVIPANERRLHRKLGPIMRYDDDT